jgi:G:T-mismatch repair DNA endonuclease (very short patch repair protein)
MTGSVDALNTYLRAVFERQATAFKINGAIGAILMNKVSGRLRYFHSSANNYKLLLDPVLVQRWEDMSPLLEMSDNEEWTDHAAMQLPNSSWQVIMVTNLTLFVYHIQAHPIGGKGPCGDDEYETDDDDDDDDDDDNDDNDDADILEPPPAKKARTTSQGTSIGGVLKIPKRNNLCVFHCLVLDNHRAASGPSRPAAPNTQAKNLFMLWWDHVMKGRNYLKFQGVAMEDLAKVEAFFRVGFNVYRLDDLPDGNRAAVLVRRVQGQYPRTINVHMPHEGHFDYIASMNHYSTSFRCNNCGQFLQSSYHCRRHEASCTRASKYDYRGGPYSPRKRFYDILEETGIWVDHQDRFYDYRVTYDLEACLVRTSDSPIYKSRHVPMSVSLASNVPGFEGPYCIVSGGDSLDMVSRMVEKLVEISDEAYRLTSQRMRPYLDALNDLKARQEQEPNLDPPTQRRRRGMTLLERAESRLENWMRAIPVVSFNGARYDLQLIKHDLATLYAITDPAHIKTQSSTKAQALANRSTGPLDDCLAYILKKGSSVMCLATRKLTFLDVCNYIAPGYSYSKYLQAYGNDQDGAKSFFPYEYVDSLKKLDDTQLPPYDAFYSSLKGENTLDEGHGEDHGRSQYAKLQELWHRQGMASLRDLLVYYNNADVEPFVKALGRHVEFFRIAGLDMLKDAPSLPGLGLKYGMEGLDGRFFTFGPNQADLAHLIYDSIVGGPSLVFCRLAVAGETTIRTPDYGHKAAMCQSIRGYDANSLYPWAMAQDMPVGPCQVRKEPDYRPETPTGNTAKPNSTIGLEWLNYEAEVRGHIRIQHAGNGPEVRIGRKQIPVDGFHAASKTIFQFHGCIFHGHTCHHAVSARDDKWLGTTLQFRRDRTERIHRYLQDTCGYTVVTMWSCEWDNLKRTVPAIKASLRSTPAPPRPSSLPDPGTDLASVLDSIREGRLFGMAVVDIHTPEALKSKFRDMPPIFKCTEVGCDDAGDHMRTYCQNSGTLKRPRRMMISSYFAVKMLIATPLIRWYLEMGLKVTRVYMILQYSPQSCFKDVTEDAANKRRAADRDPSQKLAGESAKLLVNSIYGKCCENKARFCETSFVSGPVASAAVCMPRFRDMTKLKSYADVAVPTDARDPDLEPEAMLTLQDHWEIEDCGDINDDDVYELSLAPKKIQMDLPVQIAFFVYAYAKLRMLQFRYELFETYADHRLWSPMYMDTDSYYVAIAGDALHDVIKPEKRVAFYESYHEWFPSLACDEHMDLFVETASSLSPAAWLPLRECCMNRLRYDERSPGLFKTEWTGHEMVALCSKTYYCTNKDLSDKFSCKGLQKRTNASKLTFDTYRKVLTTQQASGGVNRGIKATPGGQVYTYEQARASLSYLYVKRRVLDDGVHTEPLDL